MGCGESQQSTPSSETKPVAEAAKPEPPTVKEPNTIVISQPTNISIHEAAAYTIDTTEGNIEAVEQHLAAGTDVNVLWDGVGTTPLHRAAEQGQKEIVELLIANGENVNAKNNLGGTPLDVAKRHPKIADLLRKHGAKTGEELKTEGK